MHRAVALALFVALAAVAAVAVPSARGASPDVVVSQVFAGGGNAGAPYANDFVELFNRGSTTVDLSGWTLQYAAATGTSWQATALTGSIAPGRHYLVELASGGTVGAALPTPDTAGTSNLAVSGGKVAVVRNATALTCGAAAGSCSAVSSVADLLGYGGATDYEGAAAPAIDNTTAAVRASEGCIDTDANGSDFSSATPTPRNTAGTGATCGGAPPPGAAAQNATVDVDIQSVLSIALERPSVSFGNTTTGSTPAPVSERVTVASNGAAGYSVTVHRSAFQPADLPLGIAGSAPSGGQVGPGLANGAIAAIPVAPAADLLVGTTAARSAASGDVWDTRLGFVSPLPSVPAGRYTATVTFTVIGR